MFPCQWGGLPLISKMYNHCEKILNIFIFSVKSICQSWPKLMSGKGKRWYRFWADVFAQLWQARVIPWTVSLKEKCVSIGPRSVYSANEPKWGQSWRLIIMYLTCWYRVLIMIHERVTPENSAGSVIFWVIVVVLESSQEEEDVLVLVEGDETCMVVVLLVWLIDPQKHYLGK